MNLIAVNQKRYRYSRYIVFLLFFLAGSTAAYAVPDTIKYTGAPGFCPGGFKTLTADPAPAGAIYEWRLNGNLVSTAAAYNANAAGNVTVKVNGTIYAPLVISAYTNPTANFSSSPSGQCGSVPIAFTNTSTGNGLTYSWNFNDPNSGSNNTSILANPTHRFVGNPGNSTQNFNVALTVTSSEGCTNTKSQLVSIKQNPGTQLGGDGSVLYTDGFTYFTQCSPVPSIFTFSNQSSTSSTNTSYTIIWGDNLPDFNATSFTLATHTYNVGIYSLQFIVIGSNGCKDTGNYRVYVGSNPGLNLGQPPNTNICTNDQLTVYIGGTSQNTIGTIYTVLFSDQINNVATYFHPNVPDSVNHIFNINSCGYTSPGSNGANSFYAKVVASNPCGVAEGYRLPIHVSSKPTAVITVSPKDTVCINNPVTLNSAGPTVNNVTTTGVCSPGKVIWQISPATGWSAPPNSLGNDFNSNSVSIWSSGSINPVITFTVPGTYTIKLKIGGNTLCGLDSTTKTICVNPAPVGNFTLDNNIGCAPLTIAATNTSNSPICGTNTYAWNVTHIPTTGCLPNTPGFTYVGGTNPNSQHPQFQFTNPGVYTISLVTKSSNGACTAPTVTKQVTVKDKPFVPINALASICENGSISPTSASTCYINAATTYLWTFNGGSPATSPLANPGNITYATAGTYTIQLVVTNECGTTPATKPLTVFQKPDIIPTPNDTVCRGIATAPFTFTSTVTGTTFTWTNNTPSIGLAASGTGNIASFLPNTGTTPTTATIIVTPVNGCSGTPDTFTITVYPIPPPPTVTTPVNYCQNATAVPLTATPLANHTLCWYTVPTGGMPSTTAPTPSTTTVGFTNYYVSQKNAGGCEGPRATVVVIINVSPVLATAVPTDPTICGSSNGFITLTGLMPNTPYMVSYTKGGTTFTPTLTSNASGNIIIPNLGAGTYDNIKVTRLGCQSNTLGPVSLVDPNSPQTPTAGSNSPVCSGGTLSLTANTTAGATYTWSGPNNFTSPNPNPSISNVTTAATGNYSVTITVSGCTSGAGTVAVIINPVPAGVTAGSSSPICSGDTLKLTSSTTTTGSVTYAWTGPNAFSSNLQNPTIPNAIATASGTYSVVATLGNCSAAPKTVSVTIRPTPVITDSSFTNPSGCTSSTGSISLIGLSNNTSYAVNYLKNGTPVNATLSSNGSGVLTIPNLTAGNYSNFTVTLNTCTSNSVGPFVLVPPNPPDAPVAGSNSPICIGGTLNLTANTSGTATYNWTGPNGFTSPDQNPTITNATVAASGTYTVTATISGCTSPPATITVVVSASAGTPNAGPDQQLCNTTSATLAGNDAGSGTGTWTVIPPSTATIAQVNNPATTVTNLPSGITKMVWTISNGICQPGSDTVQITNLPSLVNTISPLNTTVCSGQPVTINGAVPAGGSGTYMYQWQQSPDNIIFTNVAGAAAINVTVSPTVTTYYRRIINSGACAGSSDTAVVIILAGITGNSISANQSVCTNTAPALLIGSLPAGGGGSFTYSWEQSVDGGINWTTIAGATGKDYQPGVLTIPTRYRRNVNTVFCGGPQVSVSNIITVDINPGPTGTLLYNSGYLCPGTPIRMEVVASNAPLIRYVFGNGDSLTTTNTVVTYPYLQPGTYVPYAYIIAGNCTVKLTRGDTVKVDRLRTGFNTQVQQACGSTTIAFTDTSNAFFGIRTWNWDFDNGTFSSLQNPVKTYNVTSTYNIKLRITGNSNCADSITIPVTITIHNKPVSAIGGDTLVCIGQPLPLSAFVQSADLVTSYNWDFGNGITATGQNVTASYNTAGIYTVRLISRTQFGCADTVYRTIRVNAAPSINAGPDVRICRGDSIRLGAIGATNWQWSPLLNLSCTTCPNPMASPLFSTTYIVTGSNGALCRANDTIQVEVIQPFDMTVSRAATICLPTDDGIQVFANGAYTYTWSPAVSLNNPNISNPTARPAVTTVYQVVGKDNYNCFTDTDYVRVDVGRNPVVNLGNDRTVTAGDTVILNPTITNGPISQYVWSPANNSININSPRLIATITKNSSYTLEVTNTIGCIGTDTINFNVICDKDKQLYVPNAFSPDGDGKNDVFMVRGKGIAAIRKLMIFNRWGAVVFERSNISANDPQQGWDGKINGSPAQIDAYVVTVEWMCTGGTIYRYQGDVTLLR